METKTPLPTRQEFLGAMGSLMLLARTAQSASGHAKVLIVVAHPDDEYAFAATTYRLARELGGTVDQARLLGFLTNLLRRERYDFVFTLLPTAETHAHHRAATLLTLEAVARLREKERPVVLGAEPGGKREGTVRFAGLPGHPATLTTRATPTLVFDRSTPFGYRHALSYQIVVNWVIAEHKSQGLFQTDMEGMTWSDSGCSQ